MKKREMRDGKLQCSHCGLWKDPDEFTWDKRKSHGRQSCCKQCNNIWNKQHPELKRESDLKCRGLLYLPGVPFTVAHEKQMLLDQDNRCPICLSVLPPNGQGKHLDHDHKTLIVRGILCDHCNHGLGKFKDNAMFLDSAAYYLREHK